MKMKTNYYQDGLLVLGGFPSLVSLLKFFGQLGDQHAEKLNLKTRLRDHWPSKTSLNQLRPASLSISVSKGEKNYFI